MAESCQAVFVETTRQRSAMQTVTSLSTVVGLLLLTLLASPFAESETLRYTVRADSLEVELARADGTKITARPPREPTYFYFLAENGWPVPEGPGVTQVRCEIRWTGFPARLATGEQLWCGSPHADI